MTPTCLQGLFEVLWNPSAFDVHLFYSALRLLWILTLVLCTLHKKSPIRSFVCFNRLLLFLWLFPFPFPPTVILNGQSSRSSETGISVKKSLTHSLVRFSCSSLLCSLFSGFPSAPAGWCGEWPVQYCGVLYAEQEPSFLLGVHTKPESFLEGRLQHQSIPRTSGETTIGETRGGCSIFDISVSNLELFWDSNFNLWNKLIMQMFMVYANKCKGSIKRRNKIQFGVKWNSAMVVTVQSCLFCWKLW